MNDKKVNISKNGESRPDIFDRLPETSIPWKRTREEVWDSLKENIEEKQGPGKVIYASFAFRMSAAAVILLLVASVTFMRLYTKTVSVPPGEHANLVLPGDSKVTLNAETIVKYKPLWWRFKRDISLEGEGYFEVSKGNIFRVISLNGIISVLGTTFNVYSRENEYEVSCYAGKVSVESAGTDGVVILNKKHKAWVNNEGELVISIESADPESQDWRNGYFRFTSVPVTRVFDEIARQFDVSIKGTSNLDLIYTGNFSKDQPIEEVLNLVCKAFGINFVSEDRNIYRVIADAN